MSSNANNPANLKSGETWSDVTAKYTVVGFDGSDLSVRVSFACHRAGYEFTTTQSEFERYLKMNGLVKAS